MFDAAVVLAGRSTKNAINVSAGPATGFKFLACAFQVKLSIG
jgi:hypothetical protein